MPNPEPWLRGPIEGVHPLIMPVFFSFAQVREDLAAHLEGITRDQLWAPMGRTTLGFHLKHIGGSVDRLTTYLLGFQLSPEQLQFLWEERIVGADLLSLQEQLHTTLAAAEGRLKSIDPNTLYEPRQVGRQALPTTVIGLLVHLAEHTQRHLGQAITIATLVRQPR